MKVLTKCIALMLILTILTSSLPLFVMAETPTPRIYGFNDVSSSHWAYNAIMEVTSHGVLDNGTDYFYPNTYVTRAEAVKALYIFVRAMLDPNAAAINFTDVLQSNSYYNYIKWAYNSDITSGATTTTFAPDRNVRKQEAITFIANTYAAYGVLFHKARNYYDDDPFTDADKIESYALKPIIYLYQQNIVNGSNGKLNPNAYITRAEFATLLNQLYKYNFFNSITVVNVGFQEPLCWAACASMVGSFRVTYTPKTAEEVAIYAKGEDFIYDNGGTLAQTVVAAEYASLNTKEFEYFNKNALATDITRIKAQVSDDCPMIICGSAKNSDGTIAGDHMIVLNGYSISSSDRVVYCDPNHKTYKEAYLSDIISGATTGYAWYYTITEV